MIRKCACAINLQHLLKIFSEISCAQIQKALPFKVVMLTYLKGLNDEIRFQENFSNRVNRWDSSFGECPGSGKLVDRKGIHG